MLAGVLARTMNTPDQDIVLTAIEDASASLGNTLHSVRATPRERAAFLIEMRFVRALSNEKAPDPPPCGNGPPGSARRPDARRCRTTYAGPNQKSPAGECLGLLRETVPTGGTIGTAS
jgi:hypothetical protein